MAAEWTEDLSTSLVDIDEQHKELFKKKNELHYACMTGKGKAEIGKAIQFLEDYVKTHFDVEEKNMLEYGYPDYDSHKAEHIDFTRTIVSLKKQFEAEGASLPVVIKTNLEMSDWLRNHICKSDRELGIYIKTRIGSSAITGR